MTLGDWLTDSKIVLTGVSWVLLLFVLLLRRVLAFGGKVVAQATLVVCFLILFSFIGSKILCKSDHNFGNQPQSVNSRIESLHADYTCWH